jgi:hypothetical protein
MIAEELSDDALEILKLALVPDPQPEKELTRAPPKPAAAAARKKLLKELVEAGLVEAVKPPGRAKTLKFRASAAGRQAYLERAGARALAASIAGRMRGLEGEIAALQGEMAALRRLAGGEAALPAAAPANPATPAARLIEAACLELAATNPAMGGSVRVPQVRERVEARGGPAGRAFDAAVLELADRGRIDIAFASDGSVPDAAGGLRLPSGLVYFIRWKG